MAEIFSNIKQTYLAIFQTSVWLISIILPFVIPPPVLMVDQGNLWLHLIQFFVAAFIGLLILPFKKYSENRHAIRWWKLACVLFACSLLVTTTYILTFRQVTVLVEVGENTYERVVIGDDLTLTAANEKRTFLDETRREATDEELIALFAPNNSSELIQIWEERSIEKNIKFLFLLHFSTVLTLSLLVLTIVQYIKCLTIH